MERKRFDVFFEKHIGLGIRWNRGGCYAFEMSFAFPFLTFMIGFGKEAC